MAKHWNNNSRTIGIRSDPMSIARLLSGATKQKTLILTTLRSDWVSSLLVYRFAKNFREVIALYASWCQKADSREARSASLRAFQRR
jgi:hypothetical protein